MPQELLDTLPATYLAGLFRSARFGLHEADGRGVASQFNYLQQAVAAPGLPAARKRQYERAVERPPLVQSAVRREGDPSAEAVEKRDLQKVYLGGQSHPGEVDA